MAKLWYGHFDSAVGDRRELLAEDWANYIRSFITDGIRNGGACLQITPGEQMKVRMDLGIANIQGYIFIAEQDNNGRYTELEVEDAHNQFDRIDRVILRLDKTEQKRTIEPMILRGVAGSSVPPALTRNKVVYDLSLAQIRVKANTLVINKENITDERFNEEVCGLINSVLGLDSSVWQKQFDDFMETVKIYNKDLASVFREEFNASQEDMQDEFQACQNEIKNWYMEVKQDITKLQTFDFDNLSSLIGVTRNTVFLSNRRTEETINNTANNKKIAYRLTEFTSSRSVIQTIKIYEDDGEAIMKTITINTTFNSDGSVKEVVN